MRKQAFTLVELIVVVTILAVLGGIGFISYSNSLDGMRDTNRIESLSSISQGLNSYLVKTDLPKPEDYTTIKSGTKTIAYQGYAGESVLNTIGYKGNGKDPKDKTYFSYYLTKNRKYFQLMAFLEEEDNKQTNLLNKTNASDYTVRFPHVSGDKLGILTDGTKTPIQELGLTNNELDIQATTDTYTANISNTTKITGDKTELKKLATLNMVGGYVAKNCKDLLSRKPGLKNTDGEFLINPTGENGEDFLVYCDMSYNGGGWTRYSEQNASGYYLKKLGKEYLKEIGNMFYAYKRGYTGDTWYAFKFKQLYFNKCGIVKGDLNNITKGARDYIDHIENNTWGNCSRTGGGMNLKTEKIVTGKYKDDACMNGTLDATNKHSRWNSKVTTDGITAGFIGHRISNTTVITGPDGRASNRCAGVDNLSKKNSETYIFVK